MQEKMIKNFKLVVEYDGSAYHGWQRQKNDTTIQAIIEASLKKITGEKIILNGSGRTDAGVHALAQTANFRCSTGLNSSIFHKALNSLLPDDIVIKECEEVTVDFHARFCAKSKTYRYRILNREIPSAIHRRHAWFIRRRLDVDAMRPAAAHLEGTHDFKSFEAAGSPRAHTVRTVMRLDMTSDADGFLLIDIEADGFLRCMVRNIVGTLVHVGLSKLQPTDMIRLIESRDRNQAGPTAPAHGLFLKQVHY